MTLWHIFGIDEALLEDIRKELAFRRLAIDEGGEGFVWIGETPTGGQPVVAYTNQPDTITNAAAISVASPVPQSSILVTDNQTNERPAYLEDTPTDISPDEQRAAPELAGSAPEVERRQLTVMFCDLVGSTDLSGKLDPEDLREVVRAYQKTAARSSCDMKAILLSIWVMACSSTLAWPRAHEDDAQRALHSGLGIVNAITTTLNPRLKQDKGVQLAVRLGAHTGPVVVGEMGGGERHENLATGETVNIAARLEGLAQANTVVISSVTERLVRGSFALENL